MNLNERIKVLDTLGKALEKGIYAPELEAVMRRTFYENAWFTTENQILSIESIAKYFLDAAKLESWLKSYNLSDSNVEKKTVALILAGNIPLVGFHDVLAVFACGHCSKVKISDKDKYLLPFLLQKMREIDPRTAAYFQVSEGFMPPFDAVIATGSNNSARYFESYFGKYPNIIRKNRNSVAILGGGESVENLTNLGDDIFAYFGLGCRNVSKIFVPKNYDFIPLLETLHEFSPQLVTYERYKNNFDYQVTLLILNKVKYMQNGCLLLAESPALSSAISVLHYEFYDDEADLSAKIARDADQIQCVVLSETAQHWAAKLDELNLPHFDFGQAQSPTLSDYADGVDTVDFLKNL